jgi:hypothetical protein
MGRDGSELGMQANEDMEMWFSISELEGGSTEY